jgi:hypothetical protein
MGPETPENAPEAAPLEARSKRSPGGPQPGAGRKPTHGYRVMRRALGQLTTRRLDGRSAVAVAVRGWKADIRRDLGDDLTRAQETILEGAAQAWVILSSLDDWISRQPSLVTRKRQLLPVVRDRMQVADSLARMLERLGLQRRARTLDPEAILARLFTDRTRGHVMTLREAPRNGRRPRLRLAVRGMLKRPRTVCGERLMALEGEALLDGLAR